MSHPVELLLGRLEGVKPRGNASWIARCPAHSDKSPSLSIREADDRVLIHCFASCSACEVVAAVGLGSPRQRTGPRGPECWR